MTLTHLNIHNVRNISQVQIKLHPKFNIFQGINGSGKTSLLEAIYLLSNGRSFRTREIAPLINYSKQDLTVFAKIEVESSISIQKTKTGSTRVKLNHNPCKKTSELLRYLPCQVFYQDIFQIIDAGPIIRRSLLDWGVFHKQKTYNILLKKYRHVLRQRNALLRAKAQSQDFKPWDKLLVSMAYDIDTLRKDYFTNLSDVFQKYLAQLTNTPCLINYYKGWDKKETKADLASILKDQLASDMQRQYTHSGPHNADILFDSLELKAKNSLSRGQQKIILIALKLSQAKLLEKPCIYLFDDITSELDNLHISRLFNVLSNIEGQFFLTTIDAAQILIQDAYIFSLTNGTVAQI